MTSTVGLTENLEKIVAIYPNPASELLEIKLPKDTESTIKLFNTLGQEIYTSNSKENKHSLNIKHIAEGIYYVQVTVNDEKYKILFSI